MAKRTEEGMRTTEFDHYKPAGRDYQPPDSLDDMTQVIQMGLESLKESNGRQATYPDTIEGFQSLYEAGVSYFERINEINEGRSEESKLVVPDFEGLAIWCKVSRVTLFKYANRGGEWTELIELFKTLITSARKQMTTTFRVPPMWEVFNLTNNAGYLNTSEFKMKVETDNSEKPIFMSQEEIHEIAEQVEQIDTKALLEALPDE